MKKADELHQKAMQKAELATIAALHSKTEEHTTLLQEAFKLEREAALLLKDKVTFEPSRSILFRSAASLAIDCHDLRMAEQMIAMALAGDPPESIGEELRDLLEQVTFERHLQLRGERLRPNEVQMSISGKGIGYGIAPGDAVLRRLDYVQKLFYRTAERFLGFPFRKQGDTTKEIKSEFGLYLAAPKARSFALNIRFAQSEQISIPGFDRADAIVSEVFNTIQLLNESKEDDLRKVIPGRDYFTNFVALVREIAPDGEDIDQVGFTMMKEGRQESIALRRTGRSINPRSRARVDSDESRSVQVVGQLRLADAVHSKGRIVLVDENNSKFTVIVPTGLLDDIVRPLWGTKVVVTGRRRGSVLILEKIDPAI